MAEEKSRLAPITEGEISGTSWKAVEAIRDAIEVHAMIESLRFDDVYRHIKDSKGNSKKVRYRAVNILRMGRVLFGESILMEYERNGKIWDWFHIAYQLEVDREIEWVRNRLEARLK